MFDQNIGTESTEAEIAASDASQKAVENLLQDLGFSSVKEMDVTGYPSSPIDRLNWVGEEIDNMNAAKQLIEDGLKREGVILGEGGFKVHDVSSKSNLLQVQLKSINMNASTDILVAPYRTADTFLPPQACILFELKTETNTKTNGLSSYEPQAIVELLAARLDSEQPNVAVVLTDLCTGANAYTCEYDSISEAFYIQRYSLALGQIFPFCAQLLREHCKPSATYRARLESSEPNEQCVLQVRKKLREDFTKTLAWEHFMELKDTAPEWSAERSRMAWDVLQAGGVEEMPSILQFSMMYN